MDYTVIIIWGWIIQLLCLHGWVDNRRVPKPCLKIFKNIKNLVSFSSLGCSLSIFTLDLLCLWFKNFCQNKPKHFFFFFVGGGHYLRGELFLHVLRIPWFSCLEVDTSNVKLYFLFIIPTLIDSTALEFIERSGLS